MACTIQPKKELDLLKDVNSIERKNVDIVLAFMLQRKKKKQNKSHFLL